MSPRDFPRIYCSGTGLSHHVQGKCVFMSDVKETIYMGERLMKWQPRTAGSSAAAVLLFDRTKIDVDCTIGRNE